MKHGTRGIALLAFVGMLAACGGTAKTAVKPVVKPADPYTYYRAHNPNHALVLSREDAQARALLGCQTHWAPGTIDYVLHAAYKAAC